MANEVWGIDIGKSALKAVKMRKAKNQIEIVGIELVEYVQASEEEVDKDEQVRQALTELRERAKIKKNERIFVSIPGQATFNRMITIPPVEPKRVKEIVTYEAQQQIPFPIEEVLWDYQLLEDKEKALEEQEVMLFAVRKEIINNFLANLASVDISVSGIQIAPLALYNYMRFDRPEHETCVVIDIGAENTDLVIVHGDKLWLRALPSAGDDITKVLQKQFNIPYQEAEKLKLKAGKSKQAKKIFEVIKPVLKDIVGEIHRSVGYYKSMVKNIKMEKMVFMGNATKLTGFSQFFSQNLQYNIETLSEVSQIRVSNQINVNLFQTNITSFAVAMGLGVQGLGMASNNIRLLPKELETKVALEIIKPYLAAAVGILAIVPFWGYISANSQVKKATNMTRKVAPQQEDIEGFYNTLVELQKDTGVTARLEYYARVGRGRYRWLEVIDSVNHSYAKAQEMIKKDRKKFWILGKEINEVLEKDTGKKYLVLELKIGFTMIDNSNKQTRDYINKYLGSYLENYKDRKGEKLYDEYALSVDRRTTLFPEQETEDEEEKSRDEKYCHATIKLKSLLSAPPKKKEQKKPAENF